VAEHALPLLTDPGRLRDMGSAAATGGAPDASGLLVDLIDEATDDAEARHER